MGGRNRLYDSILDHVTGHVTTATTFEQLNLALRGLLAGLWIEHEPERKRVLIQFELAVPPHLRNSSHVTDMVRERRRLPPQRTDAYIGGDPAREVRARLHEGRHIPGHSQR